MQFRAIELTLVLLGHFQGRIRNDTAKLVDDLENRVVSCGVLVFNNADSVDTNFNATAGLFCGVFFFLFALFVVTKNSDKKRRNIRPDISLLASLAISSGLLVYVGCDASFFSGVVNLVIHLRDSAAVSLYAGFSLLGLGLFSGAALAHYRVRGKNL